MVVNVLLSQSSIQNALNETRNFIGWVTRQIPVFVERVAEKGVEIASMKFDSAIYDGTNDAEVKWERRGDNEAAIIATGGSVLFIEFGTGIKYPDIHPQAGENGMVRGEFGHGLGKLPGGWRYRGNPGSNGEVIQEGRHKGEVHTYGNPANMPMVMTVDELKDIVEDIAREVFRYGR